MLKFSNSWYYVSSWWIHTQCLRQYIIKILEFFQIFIRKVFPTRYDIFYFLIESLLNIGVSCQAIKYRASQMSSCVCASEVKSDKLCEYLFLAHLILTVSTHQNIKKVSVYIFVSQTFLNHLHAKTSYSLSTLY